MSALPFSISSDAAAWIAEKLEMSDNDPELAGLVPGLCFFLDSQSMTEEGQVFEWCPYPHFDIGWDRPEVVVVPGSVEMEVGGRKVVVLPDTLERLKGNCLVLETVEVGFPTPADKKVQLLRIASS
jgi:hypothetical protein